MPAGLPGSNTPPLSFILQTRRVVYIILREFYIFIYTGSVLYAHSPSHQRRNLIVQRRLRQGVLSY